MNPRRWYRLKHLIYLAFAALLASCGDTALFFPIPEEQPRIEVLTVQSGTVLTPTDNISIEILFDGEVLEVDRMTIDLGAPDGVTLFSQELGAEEIQALPMPLELPEDLVTGRYVLTVSLYYLDDLVTEQQSEFYVAAEPYEITGFVSYPGIFYPGGKGLVVADLLVPEGSDPYLRWRAAGDVVGEGYLSEGADSIELEVPDRAGVFSLALELFPVGDGSRDPPVRDFLSTNRLEAQFFVSTDQTPEPHELGPEESYTSLFHFRGELVDRGRQGAETPARFTGPVTLGVADGSFGFELSPDSALVIEESLIPFDVDDVSVHPFSFSIRFVPYSFGTILAVRDENGEEYVKLEIDDAGAPAFRIGGARSSVHDAGIVLDKTLELTVSVVPGPSGLRFLWFASGLPIGDESVEFDPTDLPSHPYTTIGGEGFAGLLDELGIFSAEAEAEGEAVDSAVFARAMRLKYGSDLLLAEGFDGLDVPNGITVVGEDGTVSVEGGVATIGANARIELPPIPIDFESLRLEVATVSGDLAVDATVDVDSAPSSTRVVRYDTRLGFLSSTDEVVAPPLEEGPVRIDLTVTDDVVRLLTADGASDLLLVPYSDSDLIVTIGATGDEPFSVDSILITKNRSEEARDERIVDRQPEP